MRISLVLSFLLALSPLAVSASSAQTGEKVAQSSKTRAFSHETERAKVNKNLLLLFGGTLGGPWLHMAQDIAATVSQGDQLRVLAVAGSGGKSNLRDVLLARGVDLAITRVEILNDAKASGEFGPNLDHRVTYIAPIAVDMLQVLARPEINSLKDLHGKKVNILPKASVAPVLMKKLGVVIDPIYRNIPDGIELTRTGEIYATACICSVPIPAYGRVKSDTGLKLVEVPYIEEFEESYLPASLSSKLYPNLIAEGSKVRTIGANLLLITYNWPRATERYRRVEKFVNAFFSNFDKLRQPPRHPTWRNVNIAARVRGWRRFPAAQEWLDRHAKAAEKAPAGIDVTQARAQAARAAPHNAAEQERLFKEFLEWSRKQPKR